MTAPYLDAAAVHDHAAPDRLGVIATLHGLAACPPDRATVLEVECGAGANLLALAARSPGARFVGLDSDDTAVGAARGGATALGLANVTFMSADFAAPPPLPEAHYLIAVGVASHVAPPRRRALFDFVRAHLLPGGTALVSFDAWPGAAEHAPLHALMRFHVERVADPAAAVRQARDIALWHVQRIGRLFGRERVGALRRGLAEIDALTDDALMRLLRARDYHPQTLTELVTEAELSGLMWLANARRDEPRSQQLPDTMRELARAGSDPVRQQQYLDYFLMTRRRTSILCRADERPRREVSPEVFRGFAAAGRVPHHPLEPSDGAPVIASPLGDVTVTTAASSVLKTLAHTIPAARAVEELLADPELGLDPDEALVAIAELWQWDLIELSLAAPPVAPATPDFPRTGLLQRLQAEAARPNAVRATSLWHRTWELDEAERTTLAAMDGTIPRERLDADALRKLQRKGFILDEVDQAPRSASSG